MHNSFAPRRITNKISQIANSQQFGLFISLKLSTFWNSTSRLFSLLSFFAISPHFVNKAALSTDFWSQRIF